MTMDITWEVSFRRQKTMGFAKNNPIAHGQVVGHAYINQGWTYDQDKPFCLFYTDLYYVPLYNEKLRGTHNVRKMQPQFICAWQASPHTIHHTTIL